MLFNTARSQHTLLSTHLHNLSTTLPPSSTPPCIPTVIMVAEVLQIQAGVRPASLHEGAAGANQLRAEQKGIVFMEGFSILVYTTQ
jgi:hypothetical protein